VQSDFPILSCIIFVPVAGAILVALTPRTRPELARAIGFATTGAVAGLAGYLLWHFQAGDGSFQFVESYSWIDTLGVNFLVGVDGISLFMVAITAFLFPLGLLGLDPKIHRAKAYILWFLLLETAIMGIFTSLDLIAFFVFWEFLLVPMYFLIAGWGSSRRVYAALKFFLYTMAGSALFLVAILTLAFLHQAATGDLTFDFRVLMRWDGLSDGTEKLLFLAFVGSFAIKAPLFPFHTWLPDVHTEAPTFGSVILAGVLLKMGAYGFLRFSFSLFPEAAHSFAPLILALSVIGIVYGAVVAAMQTDMKRLIAYSSVAHMGFLILGIFSLTTLGIDGALFIMLSHPLTTGSLFFLFGYLYERRHTRDINEFGGIWKSAPVLTGLFLVATFAGIGLPGFSGFVGEFLALLGAFVSDRWFAVVATTGVILAAVYMLWAVRRVFTGPADGENATVKDLNFREIATVVPLLGLSLFLGIYPKPVLDRVEPSAKLIIAHFEERVDEFDEPTTPEVERAPEGKQIREHEAEESEEEHAR
jgi:NADH-quinone oxidoreductase subunit M